MEYKKVEPHVWKPDVPGDQMEGVLIRIDQSRAYGTNVYSLETGDGSQVILFGTAVLDDRMSYVSPGDFVKIIFQGLTKNQKGQNTKVFEVFKAVEPKGETEDVPVIKATAA